MGVESFDVITMGRVGIDFYPLQSGVGLERAAAFGKFLGGSATNVAAARHGRKTAVITRTGADPFGRFVHLKLRDLDVDDRFVTSVDDLPTPVAFCEIFPPDDFPLYFYRLPHAPDEQIRPDELDLDAIAGAKVFWITASGLAGEPSRSAHLAVDSIDAVIPFTTVVIGNVNECEFVLGEADPLAAARLLLERGVELAIIKLGPEGVLALTADEIVEMPPLVVDVVNGLGAGDSFGGAICHGLITGWSLDYVIRFANAAGALVASRLECSTAMPTSEEVERLLEGE